MTYTYKQAIYSSKGQNGWI